jgi:hypothetical protein
MTDAREASGASERTAKPIYPTLVREYNVLTPMRDGVTLAMDVVRPDAQGPFPVILVRTPYDKVSSWASQERLFRLLPEYGYAIASQDCRGRNNSDGEFTMYMDEANDGFDTVEWLAEQPWCDGNVGMYGLSYVGQTQWFAAVQRPAHLRAIVPMCSPPGHPWLNEPIVHGSIQLAAMSEWMWKMGRRSFEVPDFMETILTGEDRSFFEALPLADVPVEGHFEGTNWDIWMDHPTYDEFWRGGEYESAWPNMAVPALNITGWWDMCPSGATRNYIGMRKSAATEDARDGARLLIGPWAHVVNSTQVLSDIDHGPDALIDLDQVILRFFDRWLKRDTDADTEKPVHIFVIGADEWWEEDDWPLPDAVPTPYYLHSGGSANSVDGDGALSTAEPEAEPHDMYRYDPADPVRASWSMYDGPVDDRPQSARDDVLCYSSEVLEDAVDVVGPVSLVLYAASSARDTDWHARLVDVHPDGSARFLTHGVLRARFRESFSEPTLLAPGEVNRFEVTLDAVGVRFLPGHQIRVEITSSWFPRFERNTNSGAADQFRDAELVVADQRIYHEPDHASHVVLPIIKR